MEDKSAMEGQTIQAVIVDPGVDVQEAETPEEVDQEGDDSTNLEEIEAVLANIQTLGVRKLLEKQTKWCSTTTSQSYELFDASNGDVVLSGKQETIDDESVIVFRDVSKQPKNQETDQKTKSCLSAKKKVKVSDEPVVEYPVIMNTEFGVNCYCTYYADTSLADGSTFSKVRMKGAFTPNIEVMGRDSKIADVGGPMLIVGGFIMQCIGGLVFNIHEPGTGNTMGRISKNHSKGVAGAKPSKFDTFLIEFAPGVEAEKKLGLIAMVPVLDSVFHDFLKPEVPCSSCGCLKIFSCMHCYFCGHVVDIDLLEYC
mmetsp:Transcript_13135/g.23313  ORF Transcript_13135/g.23313 Transcript_13135/m.23313 type:complete len:312 (+) Transcript_13135:56-991(+)